jgi:hypothetical protein
MPVGGSNPTADVCDISYKEINANNVIRLPGINFKKVESVTRSGRSVTLIYKTHTIKINLATEDTATRFAFAADFLRVHCDPTAATGF